MVDNLIVHMRQAVEKVSGVHKHGSCKAWCCWCYMVMLVLEVPMPILVKMFQVHVTLMMFKVHANTAHAAHAAVGEEARKALREELANEYQLYHYIRFVNILVFIVM